MKKISNENNKKILLVACVVVVGAAVVVVVVSGFGVVVVVVVVAGAAVVVVVGAFVVVAGAGVVVVVVVVGASIKKNTKNVKIVEKLENLNQIMVKNDLEKKKQKTKIQSISIKKSLKIIKNTPNCSLPKKEYKESSLPGAHVVC